MSEETELTGLKKFFSAKTSIFTQIGIILLAIHSVWSSALITMNAVDGMQTAPRFFAGLTLQYVGILLSIFGRKNLGFIAAALGIGVGTLRDVITVAGWGDFSVLLEWWIWLLALPVLSLILLIAGRPEIGKVFGKRSQIDS